MDCAEIAVITLAAGLGTRFGSDKLMAPLGDYPLGIYIGRTLRDMGFGWRFAVCGPKSPISVHYANLGFHIIENISPEAGQAHSLHLAVAAASATRAQALLVTLADMPFVPESHLREVARAGVLTTSNNGTANMPPALFPRESWPDLLATTGDRGGAALLGSARVIAIAPVWLRDIDTAADLPASK